MTKQAFNLLEEPWIRTMRPDGSTATVNLLELFEHAHEFKDLDGETPTQNIAVLRFLLAILHAVYGKRSEGYRSVYDGEPLPPKTTEDYAMRWFALWDKKAFEAPVIAEYLTVYKDRFWLIDDKKPFYQVAGLTRGTKNTASKLNGAILESNNKVRFFTQRLGKEKESLSYPEAARWLINLIGYDDNALKPRFNKGTASPGCGWLGKLGLVTLVGHNLFETLMLNLVLQPMNSENDWGIEKPVWEKEAQVVDTDDSIKAIERIPVSPYDNPSGWLTIQSRKVLLETEDDHVIAYSEVGGDYFPADQEVLNEQMTIWRANTGKKVDREFSPKRHQPTKRLWQEFNTLMGQSQLPGVLQWQTTLLEQTGAEYFKNVAQAHIRTASVFYGDRDYMVKDIFADELSLAQSLLESKHKQDVDRITDEVAWTETLIKELNYFERSIATTLGSTKTNLFHAKENGYRAIDLPFREWLANYDPESLADRNSYEQEWRQRAANLVLDIAKNIMQQVGNQGIIGRYVMISETRGAWHTASQEYLRFKRRVFRHVHGE